MWDIQDSSLPQCKTEYAAPNTLVDGFGGEGTGLHTDNPMPWVREYGMQQLPEGGLPVMERQE